MKVLGNWAGLCGIVTLMLASCFQAPEYSLIPSIEFESVIFKDLSNPSDADSLILTIRFKDGNGDLGLGDADTLEPFNSRFFYEFSDNIWK